MLKSNDIPEIINYQGSEYRVLRRILGQVFCHKVNPKVPNIGRVSGKIETAVFRETKDGLKKMA
jgi:hypothetical protein